MKIPENLIFFNLPAFKHIKFSELPAKAPRPGVLYYVMDENDAPVGIALSGEDLSIKFYSILQVLEAENVLFDSDGLGITADNVQEAIAYLINSLPPKNNLTAERDPAADDHAGYAPGSQWFNHNTGLLWVCKAVTDLKAQWTPMSSGYGG